MKIKTCFSQKHSVIFSQILSGLPCVREKSGKLNFFQGQGIFFFVREFCKLSGKFGNTVKCEGIVREF